MEPIVLESLSSSFFDLQWPGVFVVQVIDGSRKSGDDCATSCPIALAVNRALEEEGLEHLTVGWQPYQRHGLDIYRYRLGRGSRLVKTVPADQCSNAMSEFARAFDKWYEGDMEGDEELDRPGPFAFNLDLPIVGVDGDTANG